MLGHDAIAQALVDQGVDTMFGVLGDGNLFIGEALMRNHGVRFVSATHEANAICMAEGHAKAAGKLGVATVTHGPGLTNTITALVEATRNGTPMILVAGDTATADAQHIQKIDQAALVASSGAGFEQIRNVGTIAVDIANAIRRARAERRPIVINIPYEIEFEEVEYEPAPTPVRPALALAPDPEALDTAVGIIASASRPVILAGRGAVKSGAHDALVKLGDRLGAPLATSLLGTGYFVDDPFNIGIFGTLSSPIAGETIASADCVISFGASLNFLTTDYTTLLRGKRVVQCDIDPGRIGHNVPVDAGVVGDAGTIAETMLEWLDAADHQPSAFRTGELEAKIASFDPADQIDDRSTDESVDPRTLTLRLGEILPSDRTVVVDAGRFMLDALTLPVPDPLSLVTSHGFGSIGLGMSTAIGAAVARPERPTVLGIGDGGFMMGGLIELHTAVKLGLDLIVILYNDQSYGAEHVQLYAKDMDPSASMHEWPDFVEVAQSLGCAATRVSNLGDLKTAADLINNRKPGQPVLIEATIDPGVVSKLRSPHEHPR